MYRIMPLLTVSYLLQFLDKQSLNFSSVMGIIQDLVSPAHNMIYPLPPKHLWLTVSDRIFEGHSTHGHPASFTLVISPSPTPRPSLWYGFLLGSISVLPGEAFD